MSSTNRSKARDEHKSDYYITPVPAIVEFLKAMQRIDPQVIRGPFLDPCAGGSQGVPMSYPEALQQVGVPAGQIDTIDIRQDSLAELVGSYLDMAHCKGMHNCIITNPPFSLALPIIEKALDDVLPGGHVIMLERLNFMGSKDRFPFFEKHMPKYAIVHHRRMGFGSAASTKNSTDSIEYAHFVWQQGYQPKYTQMHLI